MRRVSAAVLGIAAILLTTVAVQAQSRQQRVNVPFKFNVAGKSYPAATYSFRYEPASNQLEVLSADMARVVSLPVITRLALKPGTRNDGNVRLVFDEVGEERYLSEVWFPSLDGLLVRATSESHKHAEVAAGGK